MAVDDGSQEIREVDQQIKEEKQVEELKQSLPWFIGAAVAVIAIVGGRQYLEARQTSLAEEYALEFSIASDLADADRAGAIAAFDRIAAEGPDGYAAMAALRAGALSEETGNREAAIRYFLQVAEQGDNPERLRDLARARAGYLALDDGRDRVMQVLAGLETKDTAFGLHGREIAGLAALNGGDYQSALNYFEAIEAQAALAPQLADRATDFAALARLGADGKSLDLVSAGTDDGLVQLLDDVLQQPAAEQPPANEIDTEEETTSGN